MSIYLEELSLSGTRKERGIFAGLLVVATSLFSHFTFAVGDEACSTDWKVTGYFTPVESDYSSTEQRQITINAQEQSFHSVAFLKAVKTEGWGRTKQGWYLGRYANKWHKSKYPLNSLGKPLRMGSIATDTNIIPTGTTLKIPSLPNNLSHQLYVADDVGSAIKSTHLDIYTGEGRQAEKKTFAISGEDHTICQIKSS